MTGLDGGGYIVTWHYSGNMKGQIYGPGGTAEGGTFDVDTSSSNYKPSVASLDGGGFVAIWENQNAQDGGDLYDIRGQLFDNSGAKVGTEFRANTQIEGYQSEPSVTGLIGTDAGFVVTWQSMPQDGGGYGVYGQLYDCLLYTSPSPRD